MAKVTKSTKQTSDIMLANWTLLRCYLIICIVLALAYLLEVIKGSRDISYYAVFMAFILVPLIPSVVCYKKKQDSRKLRLLVSVGFVHICCIYHGFGIGICVCPTNADCGYGIL